MGNTYQTSDRPLTVRALIRQPPQLQATLVTPNVVLTRLNKCVAGLSTTHEAHMVLFIQLQRERHSVTAYWYLFFFKGLGLTN